MGIVSGLVLSYELGTNFGPFTEAVGEVLGPLFGYEVMTAFFLEAGFIGVMLFGWKKVGPGLHYLATLLVTIGTIISALWIMSANSWMQTPAGFHYQDGHFLVTSWYQAVINPSFLVRFSHMLLASLVSSMFIIAGVSAYYLRRNQHLDVAKNGFAFAMVAALVVVPLQAFVGDMNGLTVHKYQPLKTAAMEATWNTERGAPLHLFALPDAKNETNHYAVSIPYGASLFNTHNINGKIQGLKSVAKKDRPVVAPTFFGFRVMVGIGILYLLMALYGTWRLWLGRLYISTYFQKLCMLVAPLGLVATVAGWITAEMGRQPWIIYNQMRTVNAASNVPMEHLLVSLGLFVVVYGVLLTFYVYYLFKLIRSGPAAQIEPPTTLTSYQTWEARTNV
jgi:cytochrome d ubiquinol oxidase subunit I